MTVRLLAADGALELLLEAGHEPAGAELDHLVATLAAGERHAVERAREVHHHEVAALGLAVDGLELGRALAQPVELLADRLVGDVGLALADLEALVLAELGLRAHADLDRELQRLALLGQLADVDVGLADGDHAGVVDRRAVPAAERLAHRLVEHRLAADALDHDRRRRLAGAEAGHADVARQQLRGLRHAALDLAGADLGLDAHARLGELGSGGADIGSHESGGQRYKGARMRERFAAWFVTGPLGHLALGTRRLGGPAVARAAPAMSMRACVSRRLSAADQGPIIRSTMSRFANLPLAVRLAAAFGAAGRSPCWSSPLLAAQRLRRRSSDDRSTSSRRATSARVSLAGEVGQNVQGDRPRWPPSTSTSTTAT